ncbi:hypothetical protein, partial [Streptomyces sp. NPDC058620]|uniref:hypothetical protein n=1 Tax=Streptomyces sp. NPDC058620 TaxID=3346560 RepID=UPI0036528BA5
MFLIKSDQPKGKGPPTAAGIKFEPETERNESGKVGTAGKGNAKAKNLKGETRFDRESDTKESDRVGNARTKGSARRA